MGLAWVMRHPPLNSAWGCEAIRLGLVMGQAEGSVWRVLGQKSGLYQWAGRRSDGGRKS